MASGFIGNEVPGNRLRVRVPCPPLKQNRVFDAVFFVFRSTDRLESTNVKRPKIA